MFINADKDDKLYEKEPDFTIINACSEINDEWKEHNLNSEVAIAFNIEKDGCNIRNMVWWRK